MTISTLPISTTEHGAVTDPADIHEAFHYVTSSDPGAVGAGKYWLDTTITSRPKLKRRNAGNTSWDEVAASDTFNVLDYGALGDASHDDLTNIQDAIDAAAATGVQATVFLPTTSDYYKVTGTLVLTEKVQLLGDGVAWNTTGRGARIHSTSTTLPVIQLGNKSTDPGAAYKEGFALCNLLITGGLYGIACYYGVTHCDLERVQVTSQATGGAAVYIEGWIEKWRVEHCSFFGPTSGTAWKHAHVNGDGGFCYMDKVKFCQVEIAGGTNGMKFEFTVGDQIVFENVHISSTTSHGFYWDGGMGGVAFIACTTEGVGTGGKSNRTTGTITTGTASLVVASATGYAIADNITVQGAGSFGRDLYTVIDNIAGTTFTLHDNAGTSVTSLGVTNATADCFYFTNSIFAASSASFIGCWLQGEGASGHNRYAVNGATSFGFTFVGCYGDSNDIPVYDPDMVHTQIGGALAWRVPSSVAGHNMRGTSLSSTRAGTGAPKRSMLSTAPGGDLTIVLRDSNDAATGTFGVLEVRKNNPNRDQLFTIDSNNDVIQTRADGKLKSYGYAFIDPKANPGTCVKGDLNVNASGELYVCSATNTWTKVGSQ